MKHEDYATLFHEVTTALKPKSADAKTGVMIVSDTKVALFHHDIDPKVLHMYVELGHLPQDHEKRLALLEEMMNLNAFLGRRTNGLFATADDKAILITAMPAITKPDAARVVKRIGACVLQARHMASLFSGAAQSAAPHPATGTKPATAAAHSAGAPPAHAAPSGNPANHKPGHGG